MKDIPTPDPELERNRIRTEYDPKSIIKYEDLSKIHLHEIAPEHYIYCHQDEAELYRKKRDKLLKKDRNTHR